jgi:elongation factor P--beta-lysine ligase
MDYPTIVSALAKPKENNIFYSERFELYIGKVELVNACTELTDYLTYMDKYSLSTEERKNMKKSPYPLDMDFTKIMKKNFKPSAGAALGIDRLVMLLLGKTKIDEIMPFPIKRS